MHGWLTLRLVCWLFNEIIENNAIVWGGIRHWDGWRYIVMVLEYSASATLPYVHLVGGIWDDGKLAKAIMAREAGRIRELVWIASDEAAMNEVLGDHDFGSLEKLEVLEAAWGSVPRLDVRRWTGAWTSRSLTSLKLLRIAVPFDWLESLGTLKCLHISWAERTGGPIAGYTMDLGAFCRLMHRLQDLEELLIAGEVRGSVENRGLSRAIMRKLAKVMVLGTAKNVEKCLEAMVLQVVQKIVVDVAEDGAGRRVWAMVREATDGWKQVSAKLELGNRSGDDVVGVRIEYEGEKVCLLRWRKGMMDVARMALDLSGEMRVKDVERVTCEHWGREMRSVDRSWCKLLRSTSGVSSVTILLTSGRESLWEGLARALTAPQRCGERESDMLWPGLRRLQLVGSPSNEVIGGWWQWLKAREKRAALEELTVLGVWELDKIWEMRFMEATKVVRWEVTFR